MEIEENEFIELLNLSMAQTDRAVELADRNAKMVQDMLENWQPKPKLTTSETSALPTNHQ